MDIAEENPTRKFNESENEQTYSRTEKVEIRKKEILHFLTHYSKKSYDHSHIDDVFYKKIKKDGLTISQLYEIMCGAPAKRNPTTREINNIKKRVHHPLLVEPVSIDNFKKNVKALDYNWNSKGYLRKNSDDIKFEYAKQLHLYIQQKSSITVSLEEIPTNIIKVQKKEAEVTTTDTPISDAITDANRQHHKYCISIYFKDNLDLDAIGSLLYKLFSDSILGIIVGFGMIQIHCKYFNKSKNIKKIILQILSEDIYDGYYLYN